MLGADRVLGGLVHAALRGGPPLATGARAGPGRRGSRRADPRADPRALASRRAGSRPTPARSAPRWCCARPRATPPGSPGCARAVAPVYSLMVATEPLADATVGLDRPRRTGRRSPTRRHLIIYGQRTADGRLAFGGRGAPYHFGSRIRPSYDAEPRVFDDLRAVLRGMLPQLADVEFTHQWGGCLGIARDWAASVGLDRGTGTRLGRRLRRRRRRHHQPRRPHPRRPGHRRRQRPGHAALGRATAAAPGSPSRCAGWASTRACARCRSADVEERWTGRQSGVARLMAPLDRRPLTPTDSEEPISCRVATGIVRREYRGGFST